MFYLNDFLSVFSFSRAIIFMVNKDAYVLFLTTVSYLCFWCMQMFCCLSA